MSYVVVSEKGGQPTRYLKVRQRDGEWCWTECADDVWVFYSEEKEQADAKARKYRGKVLTIEDGQ